MEKLHEGHRQRLRARLKADGVASFSDQSLLELLLTYSILRKDTEETAFRLIQCFHNLSGVLSATREELCEVDGIEENTAIFLKLLDEVDRRAMRQSLQDKDRSTLLDSPNRAAEYVYSLLKNEKNERAILVFTDTRRRLISHMDLANGTLNEVMVYPRIVAEQALKNHAHSVILAHCHPSGDPSPSQADIDATRSVQDALSTLDIGLTDHIIVGDGQLYSFAARDFIHLSECE